MTFQEKVEIREDVERMVVFLRDLGRRIGEGYPTGTSDVFNVGVVAGTLVRLEKLISERL